MINIQLEFSLADLHELTSSINLFEPGTQKTQAQKIHYLNLVEIKRKLLQRISKHIGKPSNYKTKISLNVNECASLKMLFEVLGYYSPDNLQSNSYYYALTVDFDQQFEKQIEKEIIHHIYLYNQ